jgi:succinoglycan biosynthesis transport protein ExoP
MASPEQPKTAPPQPAPSPAPSPTPSLPPATLSPLGETHLLDRLAVLHKYRYAGLAVFLVVVAWMMVDSYTTVPVYRAAARIQIDEENAGLPGEFRDAYYYQDPEPYLNTQYRILRGRELGRRLVPKLNLDAVPEFNGQGPQPTKLAVAIQTIKGAVMTPVRAVFPAREAAVPVEPASPEDANDSPHVNAILARVQVEPVRGSRLVDVFFDAADPEFAARAVNTLVDEYVSQNLEIKVANVSNQLTWLESEVKRQEAALQESERAMAEYRERQDAGALADNQNIVITRLNQLSDEATKARTDRILKQTVWEQVKQAGQDQESLSVILQNQNVQNLRARLTELRRRQAQLSERYFDKHPDVIKVNAEITDAQQQYNLEIQKAVQNARTDYEAALARERELSRELDNQKGAATALNRKSVDYSVLQRTAETNRQTYNDLLRREQELRVVANSRANNVRVVDRAEVPGAPFTPNHRRDWMLALLFGTVLAVGAVFGLDYLDDSVRTPEDVKRRLHLPLMGLVPSVRGDRHPLLSGPVPHDFGEAFRSLRTSLMAQKSSTGPHLVAVTSAQPLEGKTTTAANIAMALAVGGARVLLIDADMRRPNVHKVVRLNNDRGLSQLLAGQARMREVVLRTHDPNLLVITAGRSPSNPSELLASERMRALIAGLESGPFDWVIIDTPPILAVTDAAIVAPLVNGVMFVIGSEMTPWRLAERAVETLRANSRTPLFAVLNKVDFARNKYYYSRYYGHQYKSYYAEAPAA